MNISGLKTAILLSYLCIASISAAIITPALPLIEHDYALTHGALEWIVSIFLLGYVVGQLLYGPIANRFGRLTSLRSGLLINIVGIVMCLIAAKHANYPFLLVGRLVTALGAASGLSCTFMLLNESLSPVRAKHAMSFAIVSFTLGIGLAVTVGGVMTQYFHWQYCFWLLLVHGVVMLMLTWQFEETLEQPIALHPRTILSGYLKALKNSQLIVLSLTVGFVSVMGYGYSAAAPIYAQVNLLLSPSQYGYWNLMNMVGMLGSGFLSAFLMKRHEAKTILFFGIICIAPVILSLVFLSLIGNTNALWFFITTTLLYLFSGLLFPAASYIASNAIPDKASASSMMSFINMGSAMMGVVIQGYLPLHSILSFAVVISSFFMMIIILNGLFFMKNIVQS
jgi:MFS transporter, DHA1 family, multidrug resistance protein